jgi:hypothetical protein
VSPASPPQTSPRSVWATPDRTPTPEESVQNIFNSVDKRFIVTTK